LLEVISMGSVAAILVAVGMVALLAAILLRAKAGRVSKTPFVKTGEAARATSGDVSVEGNVVCHSPIVAPFSGTPCLYYKLVCTAEWKEGETNKTKQIAESKVAARFSIDDGSGQVPVDAGQGGSFEPTQTKRETKGAGLLGGVTGKDIAFGQYVVSTGAFSLGTKYKVEEDVLPVQSRLYVNGSAAGGTITTPSGLRSLIISHRQRDELLSSSLKNAKLCMLGGLAGIVVGGGLGVASRVMAEPAALEAPSAVASATVAPEPVANPTAAAAAAPAEPTPATEPAATTQHEAPGAIAPATKTKTRTAASAKASTAGSAKSAAGAVAPAAAPTATAEKPAAPSSKPAAPASGKPKAKPAASK
jgi:hypothetical protein